MNSARLLSHFERISDAPDSVDRLRRFILDLAVRGKLVEQEPGELENKPPQSHPTVPFLIPGNWSWTPLHSIGKLSGGMTPSMSREEFWGGEIVWLSPKDIKADEVNTSELRLTRKAIDETSLQLYPPGSLFIVARSGILKRTLPVALNRIPAAANQDMKVLVPFDLRSSRFLQIMLRGMTPFLLKHLVKTGTTVQSLKYSEFEEQDFPLPPFAEQNRILEKVDELMMLCDRLEASQAEREGRRDRLVMASLNRLSQPTDSGEFKKDARFQLSNLNRLSTKPEHIKEIRKAILNLAVRGKLVPQDEREEPFEVNQLGDTTGSAGRKRKGNLDLYQSEELCLPNSWKALPLGALVEPDRTISYGVLVPGPDAEKGVPFVRAQDLMLHSHPPRPNKTISPEVEKPYARTRLRGGEILLCVVGSIGKLGVVPEGWSGANIARAVARIAPRPPLCRDFLLLVLRESRVQEYFLKATRTLAQPTLNVGLIEKTLIPLPPLAEQKRIVAKVDELMLICDQLETQLEYQQKGRRQLLEDLLHEALEGVG